MRWDRVAEGPAAVPGDQAPDLDFLVAGAGFEPAAYGLCGRRSFCLSLGGDALCAEDAFDLVLPSLPGYGLSDEPTDVGWDPGRVAQAWAELRRAGRRHRCRRRDGPPGNPRGWLASTSTCSWPGCSAAPPSGIRAGTRGARRARTFRTSDRATSSTGPRGRRLSATPCWIHPSPGGLDARPRHRRLVKISRAFVDGQPSDGLARDSIVGNITQYWLAGTGTRRTWCEPRGAAVRGHSGPRRSGRRRRAWRRCYGYGC